MSGGIEFSRKLRIQLYNDENTFSIPEHVNGDLVTSIGDRAFYDCGNLASVSILASVTSIGAWAFCGCSSLASVIIPAGVTSVGEGAFSKMGDF
jgi:hypothetical protein